MNEKQLMRLSVLGSVFGIVALYFVAMNLCMPLVDIGEITGEIIGNTVVVKGTVSDVYFHKDGHIFFNLKDETGEVKIVLWDDTVKQLELNHVKVRELKNGDRLEVTGVVELYKGTLEIVPLRAQVRFI